MGRRSGENYSKLGIGGQIELKEQLDLQLQKDKKERKKDEEKEKEGVGR